MPEWSFWVNNAYLSAATSSILELGITTSNLNHKCNITLISVNAN